jgi:hypothetical protein
MPLVQVRNFPEDLYKQLVIAAKLERRTVPQELITMVQLGMSMRPIIEDQKARRKKVFAEIAAHPIRLPEGAPSPEQLIREDRDSR